MHDITQTTRPLRPVCNITIWCQFWTFDISGTPGIRSTKFCSFDIIEQIYLPRRQGSASSLCPCEWTGQLDQTIVVQPLLCEDRFQLVLSSWSFFPKPKQLSRRKQLIIAVITKSVGCYNYTTRRSGRRRSRLRWWWRTRMIEDLELAVIGSHGYEELATTFLGLGILCRAVRGQAAA